MGKVTGDQLKGTFIQMLLHIPTLNCANVTFVGAGEEVLFPLWIMLIANLLVCGFDATVLAGKLSFWTCIREVFIELAALENHPTAIGTININKPTGTPLGVQVAIKVAQLTSPGAATLFHRAANLQLKNSSSLLLIKHHIEASVITERTWFPITQNAANTGLAEVLATAVGEDGISSDMEAERTLKIFGHFLLYELTLITTNF